MDQWLQESRAGDNRSRDRLFAWVHQTGLEYYYGKVPSENLLSRSDAQDLATEALIEFEKSWPGVQSVIRYCRRMWKNNLNRFLKRKRRRMKRECPLSLVGSADRLEYSIAVKPHFEFERLTDEDHRRCKLALQALEDAEPIMRNLFHYRVFAGRMTYREIAELTGATETSLRMRMARFNRRVKIRCHQLENRRLAQTEAEPPLFKRAG